MGCTGCNKRVNVTLSKQVMTSPMLESDGSIVFPEGQEVPVVEGYTPHPSDPQKLVPLEDGACDWKITGIMLQKDGSYKPHHVCRNSKCEHKTKPVTPSICQGCPFRETS